MWPFVLLERKYTAGHEKPQCTDKLSSLAAVSTSAKIEIILEMLLSKANR